MAEGRAKGGRAAEVNPAVRTWALLAVALLAVAAPPAARAQKAAKEKEQAWQVTGELTRDDPPDKARAGCYHKVHTHKMSAGTRYVIDLIDRNPSNMDPYLRLEDSAGTQLAQDDDSGGNLNARIVFTPPKTDTYRIIATTCSPGRVGHYLLRVR